MPSNAPPVWKRRRARDSLRSICLELERLYNHIGDIGAICTDVAFVTANMHCHAAQGTRAARQ